MSMDVIAARRAVQTIADGLGLDLYRAAQGIIEVVNENMLGALRLVSVLRGHDPREFALVAFGGAGPLHANALGHLLGSWPILIPKGPGLLCALGDLVTDYRNEFAKTFIRTIDQTSAGAIKTQLDELGRAAREWLEGQGIARDQQSISFQLDLRYYRQGFRVADRRRSANARTKRARTDRETIRRGSRTPLQLLPQRQARNRQPPSHGRRINPAPGDTKTRTGRRGSAAAAATTQQQIYVDGQFHFAQLYDRDKLLAGNKIKGPAVVTEMDSTTLILPGHQAQVDEFGNLLIRPEGEG